MNPKQLKVRFPYMFEGENIGLSISRGWFPLFATLCEEIDTLLGPDKRGFHWVQLKEKFGSARWYWQINGHSPDFFLDVIGEDGVITLVKRDDTGAQPSLLGHIRELVDAATMATRSLCIVCGQEATLNRDSPWVLVLCPRHAKQRRRGRLDSPWFDKEEQ